MNEDASFSMSIAPDMPPAEREALLAALRAHANVQQPVERSGDIWQIVTVIIENVAGGVSTALLLELSKKIIKWRDDARRRGQLSKVRLQRPNQQPLDLTTASDEEVGKWLLQNLSEQNSPDR